MQIHQFLPTLYLALIVLRHFVTFLSHVFQNVPSQCELPSSITVPFLLNCDQREVAATEGKKNKVTTREMPKWVVGRERHHQL